MIKSILSAGFGLCALAATAHADVIVSYNAAPGGTVEPFLEGAGVTATDITRGSGLQPVATTNGFASSGWEVGGTEASALAAGKFLEFGYDSASFLDLTSLEIGYIGSPTGPSVLSVLISADDFVTSTQVFFDNDVSATGESNTIDLTGFSNLHGTSFDIRIVGWAASDSDGTLALSNRLDKGRFAVILEGEVVPLPAALPLFMAALGGLGVMRARKKSAA